MKPINKKLKQGFSLLEDISTARSCGNRFYGREIPIEEIISGDQFEEICRQNSDELLNIKCKTKVSFVGMYELPAFMRGLRETREPYVVVSHNGDGRIHNRERREIDISSKKRATCVRDWFSVNVCNRGWRIRSIPLGLENKKWFPEQNKLDKLIRYQQVPRKSKKLIYLSYNIYNNLPQRAGTYELFEKYSWATCDRGKNGMDYGKYLEEMISHDFVLSPEGNGPDTHRTWEALYLGTIPILKKHILHQEWKNDLPIVWVDDWNEITEKLLIQKKKEIESRDYNWKWLLASYWKKEILEARQRNQFNSTLFHLQRLVKNKIQMYCEKDYFRRVE